MRLKVLKLEPYMVRLKTYPHLTENLTKIEPRIHRNGYYLLGTECWFEVDGEAYTVEGMASMFKYTMREFDRVPIGKDVVTAIKILRSKLPKHLMNKTINEFGYFTTTPQPGTRLHLFRHRKRVYARAKERGLPVPKFTNM